MSVARIGDVFKIKDKGYYILSRLEYATPGNMLVGLMGLDGVLFGWPILVTDTDRENIKIDCLVDSEAIFAIIPKEHAVFDLRLL